MKKNFFFFAVVVFCSVRFYGQGIEIIIPKIEKDSIYALSTATVQPVYKEGGLKGFYEYINKLYRVPVAFRGSGTMIALFVVDVDGQLTDIKVVKDLGFGTANEMIKVLKRSPKWIPGYNAEGKPIKVAYSLPIRISRN